MSKLKQLFATKDLQSVAMKSASTVMIILISILSAVCTYNLTMSMFQNESTAYMVTAIVEGGLLLFAFRTHNHHKAYIVLYLGFLAYSIIASRGAIMDEINTRQEAKKIDSTDYKQYKADTTSIDNQIATLQARLTSLSVNGGSIDNKALNNINNALAEKRATLTTIAVIPKNERKRNDLQKEINSLEESKKQLLSVASTLNMNESAKQAEVKEIYLQMDKLNASKEKLSEKAETIGTSNAFKESILSTGFTEIWFWTGFFIFLEVTRFFLQQKEPFKLPSFGKNNPPSDKKSIPVLEKTTQPNEKPVQMIENGRLKGMRFRLKTPRPSEKPKETVTNVTQFTPKIVPTKNKVGEIDIQKYLEFVIANQKNGQAPGRNKIVAGTNLTQEKCRTIHNILCDRGVLETMDKTTRILREVV